MFCLSVFYGVLALSVLYIDTSVKSCTPTEEHQPATLTYTWLTPNDKGLEVSWFKDSTIVSKCNSTPKCVDFFHNFSRTTAKGLNGTSVLISVSIDNVTLSASGVWILQYVGLQRNDVLMICYLNVYSRGKNVNCNYNLYSGSLIAQCQVQKIYPKALCKAYVKNKEKICADTHIMNVTNEESSKSLKYYTSTCSVAVNYQVYMKWKLDLIVIIYSNVTGDETDVQYGINETIPVEIKPTANDFSKTCTDDVDTKKCKCYTVVTDRGNTGERW